MQFSVSATLFTLLLGAVDATFIHQSASTGVGLPVASTSITTDDGHFHAIKGYFLEGCTGAPGIDFVRELCIDDGNKRAHIIWATNGQRVCFTKTYSNSETCGGSEGCWRGVCPRCWEMRYDEAPCTW